MSTKREHPFRKLFLITAAVAAAIAFRNATADKGGSYDPAADR